MEKLKIFAKGNIVEQLLTFITGVGTPTRGPEMNFLKILDTILSVQVSIQPFND